MIKWVGVVFTLLLIGGCQTAQDAGEMAAKMEAQDDAACKGRQDYQQCRRNLMMHRQQAVVQEQARRDEVADALLAASRSMQSLGNQPQNVNVTVTCAYGPGRC